MLKQLKDELKNTVDLSMQFIEGTLERNVKFTGLVLESSLASAKQMRSSKSLTDVCKARVDYLTALQREFIALSTSNTSALKEFGAAGIRLLKKGFKFEKPAMPEASEPVKSILEMAEPRVAPKKKKPAPKTP